MRDHEHSSRPGECWVHLEGATAWPAAQPKTLTLSGGLCAIAGDERSGKTSLLRLLCGDTTPAQGQRQGPTGAYVDLQLPGHEAHTPEQVWAQLKPRWPHWNEALAQALADATGLNEHAEKRLFMLSTGSRRKVGVIALLASGAAVTGLDQPYAGLDRPSIQVIRDFLSDVADRRDRAWIVADFEADPELPWRQVIRL